MTDLVNSVDRRHRHTPPATKTVTAKKTMEMTKEEAIKENKKLHKILNKNVEVQSDFKKANSSANRELTEQEISKLKDSFLLKNIVNEVHNEGAYGEENTILALINKITLRLVSNAKSTSSNTVISDETGAGKDVITGAICRILIPEEKYIHRTNLTKKALDYWGTNKPDDWTWHGSVLHLEDPEEDLIKSQTFKVLASGGNKSSSVKDQKLIDLEVKGKPVVLVTSLKASIDIEGIRRWDALRTDTSDRLTKIVVKTALDDFKGEHIDNKNKPLRYALLELKPYEVIFPHADILHEYFTSDLVMRTQVHKLIDYIKSSAILHQYQRNKDKIGRLIAEWDDYEYGRFVFSLLKNEKGCPLNKDEEEFMDVLEDSHEKMRISEIADKYKRHSKQWIYNHIEDFKEKGLIEEASEWDDRSNRNVRKISSTYVSGTNSFPSSLQLLHLTEGLKCKEQESFNGFNGFLKILKVLDDEREKAGLEPCFSNHLEKSCEMHEMLKTKDISGFKDRHEKSSNLFMYGQQERMRTILDIVKRLGSESSDGYAKREDIGHDAEGIEANGVEGCLKRLKQENMVEQRGEKYKVI